MLQFLTDTLPTPVGNIAYSVDQDGQLRSLDWVEEGRVDHYSLDRYYKDVPRISGNAPTNVRGALIAYMGGDIGAIANIAIALPGTDFQRSVWAQLCKIPAGTTCSYKDIAVAIGNPNAMRAVGMANNANPIAIVVPCHRVIGASGAMVGYGGGIKRKEWLLRHEGGKTQQEFTV